MQVDSTASDLPALPHFLSACICYSTSPAALRMAICQHMRQAEDVLCVVQVLDDWITKWGQTPVKLLPNKKEVSMNEHGVPVVKQKEKSERKDLPPLNKVCRIRLPISPQS